VKTFVFGWSRTSGDATPKRKKRSNCGSPIDLFGSTINGGQGGWKEKDHVNRLHKQGGSFRPGQNFGNGGEKTVSAVVSRKRGRKVDKTHRKSGGLRVPTDNTEKKKQRAFEWNSLRGGGGSKNQKKDELTRPN